MKFNAYQSLLQATLFLLPNNQASDLMCFIAFYC